MTPWRNEFSAMARLALPVVAVQVGLFLMNVVDAVMVGNMDPMDGGEGALAAVGVGAMYHWISLVFFFGSLMALDPVISQAVGAQDETGIALGFQRGLFLAAVFSIPGILISLCAEPALRAMDQQESVIPRASLYAQWNAAGLPAFLGFVVLRQTLQAMDRLRGLLVVIVLGNVANIFMNWMFIYGNVGAPKLGVEGAAMATVASRWMLALGLFVIEWRRLRPLLSPWREGTLRLAPILRMLRVGMPIGVQYALEFGIFGLALVLLGRVSVLAQEGHQVAINLASLSYMFPLGVSAAAAVRVGQAVGRGDAEGARRAAAVALVFGVGMMAGFAILFALFPTELAEIYSEDAEVLAMAAALIPLAGIFQIFDGTQVVSIGILRGLGDTAAPAVINIVGFWGLGLPISYLLTFDRGLGAVGMWWGLVAGLAAVAILLVARAILRVRQGAARLAIDSGDRRS